MLRIISPSPMIFSSSHHRGSRLTAEANPIYDATVMVQLGHPATSVHKKLPIRPFPEFVPLNDFI